jgi:hypothetical protein
MISVGIWQVANSQCRVSDPECGAVHVKPFSSYKNGGVSVTLCDGTPPILFVSTTGRLHHYKSMSAILLLSVDPSTPISGRAVSGISRLRPLKHWDRGFESH